MGQGRKIKSLTEIVHDKAVSRDCPLSIPQLAEMLGKSANTLYNELNPYHGGTAKLGLEDAAAIMEAIDSPDLALAMAARLGMTATIANGEPDGADMAEECLQGFHAVAEFTRAAQAGEGYLDLQPKLAAATKELDDVFKRARARDCAAQPLTLKKTG